jgi:tRNA A37 threonylcarbamoyladenosine biosynthesis protein TsaE
MGTGKTAFSRCFVREYLNDPTVQVTSPTYLLDLHYEAPTKPGITYIAHPPTAACWRLAFHQRLSV